MIVPRHSSRMQAGVEVLAILVLMQLGAVAGALTGFVVLGPIGAVVFPLIAATLFMRREGSGWRDSGWFSSIPLVKLVAWVVGTLVIASLLLFFFVVPVLREIGVQPITIRPLVVLIEGNLVNYLLFVTLVAWGSAAVGEEMLLRGFVLHRLSGIGGDVFAVVVQALIFSLAHFYQGWMGVINIFVLALILGFVFIRSGRNLWPVIVVHGVIDTISLTLIYTGNSHLILGAE